MKNLPSLIRALGAMKIAADIAAPKPLGTGVSSNGAIKPPGPLKPLKAVVPGLESVTPTASKPPGAMTGLLKPAPDMFKKTADMATKIISMLGEDAAMLALRKATKGGAQALTVPVAMDRVQQINDPNYVPNDGLNRLRKALSTVNKLSAIAPDNQSRFYAPYTPQKLMLQRNPQAEMSAAFDSNFGAQFPSALADEPQGNDMAMGNSPKVADDLENRGGIPDIPNPLHGQGRDFIAEHSLSTPDAVDKAFNSVRMFDGHDATTMNTASETGPL